MVQSIKQNINNDLGIRFLLMECSMQFSLNPISNVLDDKFITEFIYKFYEIFAHEIKTNGEKTNVILGGATQYTEERKNKFEQFITTYKPYMVYLSKLENMFKNVKINEWFYVVNPNVYIDTKKTIEIYQHIYKLNGITKQEYPEEFMDFIDKYDVLTFGKGERKKFGKGDKTKRICRWCHNSMNSPHPVTFKQTAHAISECLGNKGLVLNEECDECNEYFSTAIEQDVAEFFKLFNVIGGVHGKKGIATVKKDNLIIENNGQNKINIEFKNYDKITKLDELNNICYNCEAIVFQNLYKSLCKYALGVIPSEQLKHFDWTRRWIRYNEPISRLPVIKSLFSYMFYPEQPMITLHIRKNNDETLPYLFAQFCYQQFIYTYIVPRNQEEAKMFLDSQNYNNFWNQVTVYNKAAGWKDQDFSSTSKSMIQYNINFKNTNKP